MPIGTALREIAIDLRNAIDEVSHDQRSLAAIVNKCSYSVFVKSADGTLVLTNLQYDRTFLGGQNGIGKNGAAFLDTALADVSVNSDRMILGSCSFIEFEHSGRIYAESTNERVLAELRTFKLAMDGVGQATMSVLGITQIISLHATKAKLRRQGLKICYERFRRLTPDLQRCAAALGRGKSVGVVAEEMGVSRRCVEKHRSILMKTFDLENATQLAQLLCRLQDGGLADFGIFEIGSSEDF